MDIPYTIGFDSKRKTAYCKLRGFWDEKTVEAYVVEIRRLVAAWSSQGIKPEEISVITDTREMGVQSAELVHRFNELRASQLFTFRREAIVVESALLRMQVRRVVDQRLEVLTSDKEAEAWLSRDDTAE